MADVYRRVSTLEGEAQQRAISGTLVVVVLKFRGRVAADVFYTGRTVVKPR